MKNILVEIRKELRESVDLEYKKGVDRFFREPVEFLGVRTPVVRKISARHWKKIGNLSKSEIFELCEELLKSNMNEESTIAFDWSFRKKSEFIKEDFLIFEKWCEKYLNNWGKCDDFCTHTLGELVLKFPELIQKTRKWAESENLWVRRCSAVCLIFGVRRKEKKFLDEIFWISDKLLLDEEDLVQKAYGWALKEAANHFEKEVFEFVLKRKEKMPRTALRYAIEKMPRELKDRAMKKSDVIRCF